ncbi:PAS domain-containing sensor histidine kinase [Brevundimonas goettingensis]|uniref:histidine kinase n=1 Tax=Brevundimonas goettingensis TaxID=2774190 RepID=A0A975GUV3_9CAUL|nr:ATP-binding protein [Brevundimonas goettingensis]QTC90657.1 PAS domain-containing protein [Brevundimonas goettingensis]
MLLEGEVNWTVVFAVLAVAGHVVALIAIWFALRNRIRHASASGELNQVQKVAAETDKRLFETLNAIPVAIVQTDTQGKFTFANKAAHQLMGRRDAELLGLRFHSATWGITFPDGRPIPPDMLPSARALRGQTVRGFQHILANPSSRRKMLVSVTAMPIENEYGQIIGSTAAVVETEGLTTPEAPPAPEPAIVHPDADLTRRVFDSATSGLVVVSTHGVVREANPVALDRLGRTEGVIGADFAETFLADGQRVEGRQTLRAALQAPAGAADVIIATQADGAIVAWRILPLTNSEGVVDALLLAGDEHVPEPEVAVEPEIVPEPEAMVEPAFVTADIPEPEVQPAFEPEPIPAEAPAFDAAFDGPASGPVPGPDALDEDMPTVEPASDSAELDALRRERDAALRQAEAARAEAETAMAEADRIEARARAEEDNVRRLEGIGRVTGGMAQDFNALLGVMTSALDMMLKQAEDPAKVRRLGQAALAAGQRGEAMTARLSALSMDDENAPRTLDAGVLLRAMESRLRALAGPGVDLMIEGPSAPAIVRLDPVAFEGAVRALVANAVEAVSGSGSVAVRLETTEAGARLSVRDTGPGMDRDVIARAQEPFFTTKTGAAGLGLAQARAFARQSGGTLTIDSAPGEGAEVAVTLPAEAA